MSDTDDLKDALRAKAPSATIKPADLLSTGSTLLNLACSGNVRGGWPKGCYVFVVGDSISGKTFLTLTALAELCHNKNFDDYEIIFDNGEDGALMDVERFFGKALAERMRAPRYADGVPVYSETIEDFYDNLAEANARKKPFFYLLDSMDSLTSKDEVDKEKANRGLRRKGEKPKGDYGDGKAKKNSRNLRIARSELKKTGSILCIIGQTRDDIDAGMFESKKTRSGGHALRFYATIEMWSSTVGEHKRTVKGKDRQIGIQVRVKIKKNRLTGRKRQVDLTIYHTYGIDDIGSNIDYLIDEGHWKKDTGGSIKAPEFEFAGKRAALIKLVEEENKEKVLKSIVGEVWNDIEEACEVRRKPRYE